MPYKEKDIRLSWLAGFIDGDGCFTIRIREDKKGFIAIQPTIQLHLTIEDSWINKVKKTLEENNIKPSIQNKRKKYCEIVVYNRNSVKKLAKLLLPYLTIKKEQAKIFSGIGYHRMSENFFGVCYIHPFSVERWAKTIDKIHKLNGENRYRRWNGERIKKFYLNKLIKNKLNLSQLHKILVKVDGNKRKALKENEIRYKKGLFKVSLYHKNKKELLKGLRLPKWFIKECKENNVNLN